MKKIGFIGLGIMGKPMARNLIKAGYSLIVYNRSTPSIELIAQAGAVAAKSIAEVAENADIIITMLPGSPEVREVVIGGEGIIQSARPGTLIIDMSSIAPQDSQEIARKLSSKGIRFIDAPVSGGEPKAIDGTLSIMCGGKEEDFEEAYPVFMAMGSSAVRIGDVGAGSTAKLANQIIVAVNIAAVSEAITLAVNAGIDPNLVFKAIKDGLAGSTVLNEKAPMIIDGSFKPGAKLNLHYKDLNNVINAAKNIGSPLVLTTEVYKMMQSLRKDGEGESDHSVIAKYYEKLSKDEIQSITTR